MLKRVIAWMLLLGLVLALAGCGEGAPVPESPLGSSSLTSEVQPPAEEPEQPVSSRPEGAEQSEAPRTNDELVREMIKVYGAEEEAAPDGTVKLVAKGMGLLEQTKSWSDPVELTGLDYFEWFRSTTTQEDPAYKEEHYKHPGGEEYIFFFPQELYEERVQRYFDVSVNHLRRDEQCYDPELQGYWRGGGGGRVGKAEISYTYTKSGDYFTIKLTRTYPSGAQVTGSLHVEITGDGGWNYTRAEWYPPQVFPKEGSAWEELEGLTPEQRQLVERAEKLVRVFRVDTSGIPGDSPDNSLSYETKELGGMTYTRYRGSLYQGLEDFRADMLTVLTPEFFRRLNEIGTLQRGIFTEEDGALYFVDMARGTDRTYLPARTRYRIEPGGEDSGTIAITRYAYYCDYGEDPEKDPEPLSYRECPITLVNTADGWRVAELTLPY